MLCKGPLTRETNLVYERAKILIKTTSKRDITNYQNTPKKLFDRSFKTFWLCTPNACQNMLNSRKKLKKERKTIKLGANLSKKWVYMQMQVARCEMKIINTVEGGQKRCLHYGTTLKKRESTDFSEHV